MLFAFRIQHIHSGRFPETDIALSFLIALLQNGSGPTTIQSGNMFPNHSPQDKRNTQTESIKNLLLNNFRTILKYWYLYPKTQVLKGRTNGKEGRESNHKRKTRPKGRGFYGHPRESPFLNSFAA
ncbi:MAG: hypothetical protein ACLQBD_20105 [Syntrophobacteraceae bacterium]